MNPLLETPLHAWHTAHGARLVDFAGWSMPVQYSSIVEEHAATRSAAGLFDISHMGRLCFDGRGAERFLDRLVTRRVAGMAQGRIRYALVCNDEGGILDDVLVYHLREHGGGLYFLVVVNAGNRQKILSWIARQLGTTADVELSDLTGETAMFAVQGPQALRIVEPLVGADVGGLSYYTGVETTICGQLGVVSRTGYTGEDGCELIVPAAHATEIWERIRSAGQELGLRPAGLGARDTLRLEAAMPLYGHELSERIHPLEAGLAFAVDLEGRDFIGRDALLQSQADPNWPRRIGLQLTGKRIPREGCGVLAGPEPGAERIGEVTSGTFSPTLGVPIAMAYVRPEFAEAGRALAVDIRGQAAPAVVAPLPFYRRPK